MTEKKLKCNECGEEYSAETVTNKTCPDCKCELVAPKQYEVTKTKTWVGFVQAFDEDEAYDIAREELCFDDDWDYHNEETTITEKVPEPETKAA